MRILALEPYYGGSHQAFLEGWSAASHHDWTVLELPAHKWKWRMRHSAVTFADRAEKLAAQGSTWDALFCSDMLNLAEFLGLAPGRIRDLPRIAYFHENQLTYPVRFETERDYQFAVTNMTTALAADAVWFNSAFHRDSFIDALTAFLKRMPDYQPVEVVSQIRQKASVFHPGVSPLPAPGKSKRGALRILWAARWEHDKDPATFFKALKILKDRGLAFRLSVVGEQFRDMPEVFQWARQHFADRIDRWGYQASRAAYEAALGEADVFVSTAQHEFFGLSAVEATLAGAYPLLPERLAYPEIFGPQRDETATRFFYDGSAESLAERLVELDRRANSGSGLTDLAAELRQRLKRFEWPARAALLDDALVGITSGGRPFHRR